MKRVFFTQALLSSGVVAVTIGATTEAYAADCSSLPNPVYVAGSSAVKPMLKQASLIVGAAATPVTIVYSSLGSCAGLDAITNGTKVTATPVVWDAQGTAITCTLPVAGVAADIGVSDVFPTTCPNITVPAGQKDFLGPVQVMNFIAPIASTENSISAEAAYAVLGYGGTQYPVAPWIDASFLFIRPDTSGTKQMIATALGLSASKWKGSVKAGSGDVLAAVSGSTNANATLGIIASDFADANRATTKVLAYQHKGQSCGYYPDSSPTSFDKLNVREGRYALWGSLHLVTAVNGQGTPSNASATALINAFTRSGLTAAQKQSMIDAEVSAHVVSLCAMKVSRTSEVGAEASFQPDEMCGCYYDFKAAGAAPASCKTCTDDSGCSGSTPKCHYGYCEAK
jgi:ABC-type phosphate transport system substrate-binding protein